ncbi:MAG: hypoxanthine phosphoribosyltransferase [Bacteroidales bacterium]|jgi:hypoxanthine phosphoribosyltransferase|nr:hypoxanthine phosphoribosyltransferase [Bacteroidales bacterium]MBR4646154.1 hypoxanthine phosphoribosyltransferase [Bacteroidales bacterium]
MSEKVTFLDKTFVKYISSEEIDDAIARVASDIMLEYRYDDPIMLITLNGAIVFAVDLLKRLDFPCRITCVKLASYSGTESSGTINQLIGLSEDIRGKRILILEDIVDTGATYIHLHKMLTEAGAKDVRIATMTMKPDAYKADLPVHYVGINIPNKFVIGRGLDYDGYGRNLPDIYQVISE